MTPANRTTNKTSNKTLLLSRWVTLRYKWYKSQTGFQEWNFCQPQTEIFLKTSSQWVQLDQSDCLLWSAYEVWPIRLFVLHTLWTFRVTSLVASWFVSFYLVIPVTSSYQNSRRLLWPETGVERPGLSLPEKVKWLFSTFGIILAFHTLITLIKFAN